MFYENNLIKIEIEQFQIPWLKIFTAKPIKEFSQCSSEVQLEIKDFNLFLKQLYHKL